MKLIKALKQTLFGILKKRMVVHCLVLLFFMFISGFAAVRLGQDVSFDLHNYHYNNPHALIQGTTNRNIAVSGVQSYENPLRDVPAYLLMNNLSPKKAGFIIGALQGINLWLVFEILFISLSYLRIDRRKRLALSFMVGCFTLLGSGFYSEVGTTMGDTTTSIFVLLSVLLLICSKRYVYGLFGINILRFLSFFSIGVSAGLKLTNIAFLLGLFVSSFVIIDKSKTMMRRISLDVAAIVSGVLLAGGIWYIKMWLQFKNPIFPFYNGIFKSEYYPAENFIDTRWTKAPLWQAMLEPFSYIKHQAISSEVYFRDPRLAVMFVVVLLAGVYAAYVRFQLKRPQETIKNWIAYKMLLIFLFVSYVAWAVQFSYYRYLIVIELLSLAIITLSVLFLLKKFWLSSFVILFLCSVITLNTIQTSWGRVPWQPTNFGVTRESFKELENSVIIIAGYQPYSFLIPYLPDTVEVLRIESDLSSPSKGSEKMQALLNNRFIAGIEANKPLYLIRVDEDKKFADAILESHELGISECKEIPVIVRNASPNKYRICRLVSL